MTSYPDVSFLHVSTTFREIKCKKQFFQTRKNVSDLPQTDLHPFRKDVQSAKQIRFSTFECFQKFEKIIHRKSDSP